MMSASVACESQHSADDYVSEPIAVTDSQSSEFNLMEVEYLQHIIQSHIDAQGTETDSSGLSHLEENLYDDPDRCISCSPQTPIVCRPDVTSVSESANTASNADIQKIKMLLLTESNGALGCETTPDSGAELPNSVLDKLEETDELRQRDTQPLKRRTSPPARVCLEKRFLSVLCHSTNTSRIPTHAQIEKWSKPDKMVKIQGTYPYEGRLFKTSELILPTELTVSLRADRGSESVMRAPLVIYTDTADQQTADTLKNEAVDKSVHPIRRVRTRPLRTSNFTQGSENRKPCGDMSGTKRVRTRSLMDRTQRKEAHNRKERDRRRRIRLCCDELNLLVPFCYADTDKATTLQWTTAFLKYIQEIHGDQLKQDFQSTFCGKTGLRLKPSCVSVALIDKT